MKTLNIFLKKGIIVLILLVNNQYLFSQTIELIQQINSGTKFLVFLDYNNGTLVAEKTYELVYSNGEFAVTGYNSNTKSIGTWNYKNANPSLSEISLWGLVYVFDGNGNIYYKDNGLSGKIIRDNWISYITSGMPFHAILINEIGTLAAGKTYDVVYLNGEFAVTGYNSKTKSIGTWNYKNANPSLREISLWGLKVKFDDNGILFDVNNNKCGVLYK